LRAANKNIQLFHSSGGFGTKDGQKR
jgi:hypothetical protein